MLLIRNILQLNTANNVRNKTLLNYDVNHTAWNVEPAGKEEPTAFKIPVPSALNSNLEPFGEST